MSKFRIKSVLITWGLFFAVLLSIIVIVVVQISTEGAIRGAIVRTISNKSRSLSEKVVWSETHVPSLDASYAEDTDGMSFVILSKEGDVICGELPSDLSISDLPEQYVTEERNTEKNKYYVRKDRLHKKLKTEDDPPETPEINEQNQPTKYYLYSIINAGEVNTVFHQVRRIVITVTIAVMALMIVTCIVLSKALSRPIERLSEETSEIIRTKDYSASLSNRSFREIAELTDTYNSLLAQVNRTITSQEQFNRNISHELRTPVTVLKAQCDNAKKHVHDEESKKIIAVVERQTNRINSLIQTLLKLSRIDEQRVEISGETVSIPDIVDSICEDISYVRERDDLFSFDIENIEISANNELILTMLRNIINNAVMYSVDRDDVDNALSENTAAVDISAFLAYDGIHIEVADHGIGMDEEEISHIFDSFYRAESSRSSEGFGLGLTLSERIAKLYEGEILVESEKNKGSRFTVLLPLDLMEE